MNRIQNADNPQQALWRLEMLIQLGAPYWSLESIRKLIFLGIKYVIIAKPINGQRRLEGIYRLASAEAYGINLDRVDPPHNRLQGDSTRLVGSILW